MELINLKDIKSLYQSAKSSGSKVDADSYIEAVNDCLQNDPYQYASNIEYIISSSYGIKTFKEFFDRYGIPLISYDTIMESIDTAIKKCSFSNIKTDIYNETKALLESFRNKYQNAFIMFESYDGDTDISRDDYLKLYYKEHFKLNIPRVLSQFGEVAIPDVIIEADMNNKIETTLELLSESITTDEPAKYYQWLSEVTADIQNSSDRVQGFKKKFTEKSLEGIVNSIKLRNVILHKESVLMDEPRNLEYSENDIQVMKDFISFKEYYITAIDDPSRIESIQSKIISVYEEFDGIVPEEESCADIVGMLPGTTVDKKVLSKQYYPGMELSEYLDESTSNKKSGEVPDYLKNHHDLSYGEDDSNKVGGPGGDPKISTSTSTDVDDMQLPSDFLRKPTNNVSKHDDSDVKDDKKDNNSPTPANHSAPVNNYYYTYNNSFNKHRNSHHTDNSTHSDSHDSLEYNSNSNNDGVVKQESTDMFSLDIFGGLPYFFESKKDIDSYKDALAIFDSLTEKEKQWVAHGDYKDSPYTCYRKIYKVDGENAGFIDIMTYLRDQLIITTAVKKEFRRRGLTGTMVSDAVKFFTGSRFKTMIWRASTDNAISNDAAKKYGFKLVDSTNVYELSLGKDKIMNESTNESEDNTDPEKPTSDHPIRDTLMDIDRKLTSKQQEVKKTVQDAVNVGKTFIKPAQRTAGWINSMVNQWKDTNETNIKEKMADPRSRQGLYQSIKKAIIAGSLFKAGLLLNPIFLFLAITKKVSNDKNAFRIRNEMIGELKAELAVMDEKIKDADNNRDNGAKYKLMRFKTELQKKLLRVEGGKKMAKII
jgi:RimJ/RimL family protein N-acetyltransferase